MEEDKKEADVLLFVEKELEETDPEDTLLFNIDIEAYKEWKKNRNNK